MTEPDDRTAGERWCGRLWLLPDRRMIVYVGTGSTSSSHQHHAVQLVVALDGEISLTLGDTTRQLWSALIPRDTRHAVDVDGPALVMWIDPHCPTGHMLDSWADDLQGQELGLSIGHVDVTDPDLDVINLVDVVLAKLQVVPETPRPVSRHVQRALSYLEAELSSAPTLSEAAARAAISPSRLTHLFTLEVGIPFRRYALWLRLLRAIESVIAGNDLTGAAADAGFSDSAHLSRTFRSTFGLTPSAMFVLEIARTTEAQSALRGFVEWQDPIKEPR